MLRLAHIGIAVKNLDDALPRLAEILGVSSEGFSRRESLEEGVKICETEIAGVEIELIEPINSNSPISSFLAKRGEGIHHLCFEVEDIFAHFQRLKCAGVNLLSHEVKRAKDYYYFFVHPKSSCGALIEFKQSLKELEYGKKH